MRFRTSPRVLVVVLALVLRLGWVLAKGADGLQYSDDARAYNDLATNLVQLHRFVTTVDAPNRVDLPYAARPPLTPFLLAGVYLVFGPHLLAAQIALAVIGALSSIVVFELGCRLFDSRVAVLAGLFAAAYPFFVFVSAVPLTENLAIPLYCVLALLMLPGRPGPSIRHAIAIGAVLGLSTLNRPQLLGFVPFLAVLTLANQGLSRWRGGLTWLAVAVACWAAVLSPWMIRNRLVVGGWFPISLQGGLALYAGNNPYTQSAIDGLKSGGRGWYDDPRMLPVVSGLSSFEEADKKALRLGVSFILHDPGRSASYSIQKLGIFFSSYSNWVARLSWYPVLVGSLAGFFLTRRRWRELLPIYFLILQTMLTAAIFTSMPRFRAPVEPLFLLMAAYAANWGWTSCVNREPDRRAAPRSVAEVQ